MDAAQGVVTAVEDGGWHRHDHHAPAKVKEPNTPPASSPVEAGRRAQMARALRQLPTVRAEFEAGSISSPHRADRLRPRQPPSSRKLVGLDEQLARLAARDSYRRFDARLTD
ncbi:MAG: hypothetical protein R2746_07010 [Acidimicrobiales bacterium]